MSVHPLAEFRPDQDELLRLVRRRVDRSMLEEIAAADWGNDVHEHLGALHRIVAGFVPTPMSWHPREVLGLVRWSEPEDPGKSKDSPGRRGHWQRLFCCTVLVHANQLPENREYSLGEDSTLVQLADSALKLGDESACSALRFVTWHLAYGAWDAPERPYFAAAALILATACGQGSPDAIEHLLMTVCDFDRPLDRFVKRSVRSDRWRELIQRHLIDAAPPNSDVAAVARSILGPTLI